jgi:hypothetical protein
VATESSRREAKELRVPTGTLHTFRLTPPTGWVEIGVADENGSPLVGTRYEIHDEAGKVVQKGAISQRVTRVHFLSERHRYKVVFPDLDQSALVT